MRESKGVSEESLTNENQLVRETSVPLLSIVYYHCIVSLGVKLTSKVLEVIPRTVTLKSVVLSGHQSPGKEPLHFGTRTLTKKTRWVSPSLDSVTYLR